MVFFKVSKKKKKHQSICRMICQKESNSDCPGANHFRQTKEHIEEGSLALLDATHGWCHPVMKLLECCWTVFTVIDVNIVHGDGYDIWTVLSRSLW